MIDGTKSAPPRNTLSRLYRPAIQERLTTGLSRQIVRIEAPAGYGKTEAMASLFHSADRRKAQALWVSLGPNLDAAALQARIASFLQIDRTDQTTILSALSGLDSQLEIYLDDADRLADAAVLGWLFDQPPDQLRLMVAGRRLPDLRLSRLRMRGLLTEITIKDLAFNRGEMQQLLRHFLTPDEMEAIIATLCGWPALARLALFQCEAGANGLEREALVRGEARVYHEFLHDEVFPALAPPDWQVLRAVCGLGDFTLRIASDLAGLPYDFLTQGRIERLAPLIIPEDQNPGWFRLSPVAAKALEAVSAAEPPGTRHARHIRAAELYSDLGLLEKSVLHASLAGDIQLAVRTIEEAGGVNLFLRAGYTELERIVKAVPHDVVLATPSLRLCRVVMLGKTGQIGEARAVLDLLKDDTEAGRIPVNDGWRAMLRHIDNLHAVYEDKALDDAYAAGLRDEVDRYGHENTWQLAWIYNQLAICYTRLGDLGAAESSARRGLSLYQEERSSYPQAFMLIHLGFINYRANWIQPALDHLAQALKLINARHWNDTNLLAIANVPLAAIRYLQGQLTEARQLLERDMQILARGEGWVDFYVQGYAALARIRFVQDGWAGAQETLQDGLALAHGRALPRLRLSLSILRAELQTRACHLDAAETTVRQWPAIDRPTDWPTQREQREARLAVARLRLREGLTEDARHLLVDLAREAREDQRWGLLIRVSLLLSEACTRLSEIDAALVALEEAATLSRPGGQIQQFRDEGAEFAEVMRKLIRRAGLSRLGHGTSQYIAAAAAPKARRSGKGGLLSRRESEILLLLGENLSNKAIARRLEVGEPTVKFHLKNLFSKLGVSRRSLAVSVARASGLLD